MSRTPPNNPNNPKYNTQHYITNTTQKKQIYTTYQKNNPNKTYNPNKPKKTIPNTKNTNPKIFHCSVPHWVDVFLDPLTTESGKYICDLLGCRYRTTCSVFPSSMYFKGKRIPSTKNPTSTFLFLRCLGKKAISTTKDSNNVNFTITRMFCESLSWKCVFWISVHVQG